MRTKSAFRSERRSDKKRRKRGMQVSGRSVRLLQEIALRRAKETAT